MTRLVQAIDPGQPVAASTTIRGIVSEQLARPRLNALLAVGFGLAALALAALGDLGGSGGVDLPPSGRAGRSSGPRLVAARLFGLALSDGLRPAFLGALTGTALALAAAAASSRASSSG